MTASWMNIFGGNPVAPTNAQYEAVTLSEDVVLVWPIETNTGTPYVAAFMDVSPTAGGFYIAMPSALEGSTGIVSVMSNIGDFNFTLTDTVGNDIAIIATGETWIIVLQDNSTANGTWEVLQLGSTVSNAQAASLAGAGLQAYLGKLRSKIDTYSYSANHALDDTHRASAVMLTGAVAATFALDAAATLTAGWWCLVANRSTAVLTISAANSIDGVASIDLPPSGTTIPYTALIVCDGTTFNVFGGVPIPTPIAAGGTGATTADDALTNLGGTAIGKGIFTAATSAAVLALLGISQTLIRESTVSSNQSIAGGASGTAFVCTAALTMTLAEADTLTNAFFILVYAQGGNVTITPAATDSIDADTAGNSFTLSQGESILLTTDAILAWWPFFLPTAATAAAGTWAAAGGTANAITATYAPANLALTDGLLLGIRALGANTTVAPTFAPDGLTAHTITKEGGVQLAIGDIPGQNAECLLRYSLANTRWELLNPAVTEPPWAAAGGTADAITATYSPAVSALYDGLLLDFRATAANATTTPTFEPNGLGALTIVKGGGSALAAGDIAGALAECQVRYNLANTRWELMNPAVSGGGGGGGNALPGAYSNLGIQTTSNTNVQVAAVSAVLGQTVGGPSLIETAISLNIDTGTSGVDGLDTGTIAADTWYSVWLISTGSGVHGLLSLSATTPTLPGGYTYYTRFGWVLTDGSDLVRTLQFGDRVRYTSPPLPTMANGSVGNITTPSWSPVSVAAFVPVTASSISVVAQATGTNGTVIVAPNNSYGGWNNVTNTPPMVLQSGGSAATSAEGADFVLESGSIYWASLGSGNRLYCAGWQDNL